MKNANAPHLLALEFFIAAEKGDMKNLNRFIHEQPAYINHARLGSDTLLLRAVAGGKIKAVKALLKADADPNQANKGGNTPLLLAAFMNDFEMVDTLLKAGADPTHKDKHGLSAASYAHEHANFKIARHLEKAAVAWKENQQKIRSSQKMKAVPRRKPDPAYSRYVLRFPT